MVARLLGRTGDHWRDAQLRPRREETQYRNEPSPDRLEDSNPSA